jgi:hypothetical protein
MMLLAVAVAVAEARELAVCRAHQQSDSLAVRLAPGCWLLVGTQGASAPILPAPAPVSE